MLTETAQRALAPAINDPGTAIDIIGTVTRLRCGLANGVASAEAEELRHPRVAHAERAPRFSGKIMVGGSDQQRLVAIADWCKHNP